MIINDTNYRVDLTYIDNIKYLIFTNLFFSNLYENNTYIQDLTEIISKHIDCLSIDFSKTNYMFIIKIKKTSMKKIRGFSHEPNFYYQIISEIFDEFIHKNENVILSILSQNYSDPERALQYLYSNTYILANFCHVSSITDNMLTIKL